MPRDITPPSPPLGKSFWLDGKFQGWQRAPLVKWIQIRGGHVRDTIDSDLDYLVLDESRRSARTKPPAVRDATRINKAGGAITTLYRNDLCVLLCPARDEALALLSAGPEMRERWNQSQPGEKDTVRIDLTGADLSGLDLSGFDFRGSNVEGVRLDGARVDKARFGVLRGIDFRPTVGALDLHVEAIEGCLFDGVNAAELAVGYRGKVIGSSFVGANLTDARLADQECQGCDFSDADLSAARLSKVRATGLRAPRGRFCQGNLSEARLAGAELAGADFTGANLDRADLSGANLAGATFTGARLFGANLSGANLTGALLRDANLAEADLTGAILDGTDLTGSNLRETRLAAPATNVGQPRGPGPMLTRFASELCPTPRTSFGFWLLSPTRGYCVVAFSHLVGRKPPEVYLRGGEGKQRTTGTTWVGALLDLAANYSESVPLLDRCHVTSATRPKTAEARLVQALCEVFGQPVPDDKSVKQARVSAAAASLARREAIVADMRIRGAVAWNERPKIEHDVHRDLTGIDLAGASLRALDLNFTDASGANFAGADLCEAELFHTKFVGANLRRADLRQARMLAANCTGADAEGALLCGAALGDSDWTGANLRDADLSGANAGGRYSNLLRLEGADLTGANLSGLDFGVIRYNSATRLPAGFIPDARWRQVDRPREPDPVPAPPARETLDFAAFFTRLPGVVEAGRIANALAMLKAEKFTLFAETSDTQVIGVVRSQSTGARVYACRLTADGEFECGTQNLRTCGGLRGAVCKHLLVLIVGLTKSAVLDCGTAYQWLQLAARHSAGFDKNVLATTFLRYKEAETGTVDWRPTETVPEDYYAL